MSLLTLLNGGSNSHTDPLGDITGSGSLALTGEKGSSSALSLTGSPSLTATGSKAVAPALGAVTASAGGSLTGAKGSSGTFGSITASAGGSLAGAKGSSGTLGTISASPAFSFSGEQDASADLGTITGSAGGSVTGLKGIRAALGGLTGTGGFAFSGSAAAVVVDPCAAGFTAGEMPVFDRSGTRIGELVWTDDWAITEPRTYRFNEIEDMTFTIPYRDSDGAPLYTAAMKALLAEDNHVYIENELPMPGWGGIISNVVEGNDRVTITVLSGLSLFGDLSTSKIRQSGGTSSMLAGRLVAAAAAKQGAHGDLVPAFVIDGSTDLPGIYEYEGDILSGLQRLATDGLCEMYAQAVLGPCAETLGYDLHWNAAVVSEDHTAIVIADGPGGNLKSSPELLYSGLEVINHAIMRGLPTSLGDYVDYAAVRDIIKDVIPEIEVTLDNVVAPNYRRREDLTLTVNFGYPEDLQKSMAAEIQQRYVDYFKTFLYAYHHRQGKPYLEGFDWQGPDGTNETKLTETNYRTINKLGRVGGATVITAESDSDVPTASITDWTLDSITTPVGFVGGFALDWADETQHYVADYDTGGVSLIDADGIVTFWGQVADPTFSTDIVVGIATDAAAITTLWAITSDPAGTIAYIKAFDANSGDLLSQFSFPYSHASDGAVDFENGLLYLCSSDNGIVDVRDLNNGTLLSTIDTQLANCVGITISGGMLYAVSSTGIFNILYLSTGHLAGTFNSGQNVWGAMLADFVNHRIYISDSNGALLAYFALVAVASVDAPGSVDGAPGFDSIIAGQFCHIVETSDGAYKPENTAGPSTSYTVKSGDTLWSIALHYYGSGSSWPTIYNANKAHIIAVAESHGFTTDFAHWIFPGEVLTIPGPGGTSTPSTATTDSKSLVVYTPGKWDTEVIPGPIGEPAMLQRSWVFRAPQVVGFVLMGSDHCVVQSPKCVIQGEEGRVDDWNPGLDGYGQYKDSAYFRTPTGHTKDEGAGWYAHDWDVPDSNWTIAQQDWPAGATYLADYLAHRNREVTVQSFFVTTEGGVWSTIKRGATYTLQVSLQGPVDAPTTAVIRVLAFAPNELAGEMEITAEVWPL